MLYAFGTFCEQPEHLVPLQHQAVWKKWGNKNAKYDYRNSGCEESFVIEQKPSYGSIQG